MDKFRYKYTAMFSAAVTLTFIMALSSPVLASCLPGELGNWSLASEHVTDLTTSENLGRWTSASYVRSESPARIDVQLTEGPGPGVLLVPEGMISSDDGPIGFLSTYETLSVAGIRAVLERGDVTGQALAVALGARTVTFEARGISREELLSFAENMIKALLDER